MKCPHCGEPILSTRASEDYERAKRSAPMRGGYIWEGARPQYESGEYKDPALGELLEAGLLEPHPDPTKGWIVNDHPPDHPAAHSAPRARPNQSAKLD